jgi:hypothetical protein
MVRLFRRRILHQLLRQLSQESLRFWTTSSSLPTPINPNCEAGHYYLLNNYNPGYFRKRQQRVHGQQPEQYRFTIPPSSVPSIGDSLIAANISWKYYGDQWNNYVKDPYQLNYGGTGADSDEYCNICNPFQYDTSIMANAYGPQGSHSGHGQSLLRDPVRNAAGGFLHQAQRAGGRPSIILEAGSF